MRAVLCRRKFRCWLAICAGLVSAPVFAAEPEIGATIIAPINDAKVPAVEYIRGRVHLKGWPIALVSAELNSDGWWVQAPATPTQPGHFQAPIRVGNFSTKPGTAFKVQVVMARSPEEFQRFKPGDVITNIPDDMPRSATIRVVLEEDNAPRVPDVVLSPTPLTPVPRHETVKGKVGRGQIPVLLVRSADPKGEWWVQKAPLVTPDGRFEGQVLFGNDKTMIGQSFHLMVLCASADDHLNFKEGDVLFVLPKNVPRSEEIIVIRTNEELDAVAKIGN